MQHLTGTYKWHMCVDLPLANKGFHLLYVQTWVKGHHVVLVISNQQIYGSTR